MSQAIRAIACEGFPPFGAFKIVFPEVKDKPDTLAEVHLLTGVNGTGKTRLLSILAGVFGGKDELQKRLGGRSNIFRVLEHDENWNVIGVPTSDEESRSLHRVNWNQPPRCHQFPAFAYHGRAYVADADIGALVRMEKPTRQECLSFHRPVEYSKRLLQGIANLKMQAAMDMQNAMNTLREAGGPPRSRAIDLVGVLERTIQEITGRPFMLMVNTYPQPTLRVKWGIDELPFDLLPDGLRGIIGWMVDAVVMMDAWLDGKANLTESDAFILLDEIESHLHPVWQRRVLPAFQRLFPKAQIFVATHSPFVIASLNHGWIHRLTIEDNGQVKIHPPQAASQGDSYISVLEDIMGLKEWYDPETEQLLVDFRRERDAAFRGDQEALIRSKEMARRIGSRSAELGFIMGRELYQMEQRLEKAAPH